MCMLQYKYTSLCPLDLNQFDCDGTSPINIDKKSARAEIAQINEEIFEIQRRLYGHKNHKVLIVLQGMDTSGKNGVIRNVFSGLNPQTVHVASFEKPTSQELSHDYLWRVHQHTPAMGEIVIFDRSHYEDILAVRVNKLRPESIWSKRYDHIVNFEQMLADEGTTIIKCFLHLSKDEQKNRLQSRLDDPEKQWKFDESDIVARKKWGEYMTAYQDVFEKTDRPHAPWYIIPANRKWYRDLVFARILLTHLQDLHIERPPIKYDPSKIVIE